MESDADKCPETLLEDMDREQLNKWLSAYVAELRKVNGEPYPPSTLQSLLSGLLRYMRSVDEKRAPNIFAKSNPAFKELHCTMDSVYKQLCSDGVGAEIHSAEPFSKRKTSCWNRESWVPIHPILYFKLCFSITARTFVWEVVRSIGT